jgi:hypothetical protein
MINNLFVFSPTWPSGERKALLQFLAGPRCRLFHRNGEPRVVRALSSDLDVILGITGSAQEAIWLLQDLQESRRSRVAHATHAHRQVHTFRFGSVADLIEPLKSLGRFRPNDAGARTIGNLSPSELLVRPAELAGVPRLARLPLAA